MVNYNGRAYLEESLPTLLDQTFRDFEVIVVDHCSTDGSVEFLRAEFPWVRVLEPGANLGFGAGNNYGIRHARGDLIVVTNYDTIFHERWLERMVERADSAPDIGIVSPKILLHSQPEAVHTIGLAFQYTGHARSRGYLEPGSAFDRLEELGSATGCCFLVKQEVLDHVGVFDEEYHEFSDDFFHSSLEDVDLSWRARLAGYRIVLEPESEMLHKYDPKPLTPLRYYYLECGRYYTVAKNYRIATLALLMPAMLVSEILIWGYVVLKGPAFVGQKLRSYAWLVRNGATLRRGRRESQRVRSVGDARILPLFQRETEIRHIRMPAWLRRIVEVPVNGFFRLYGSAVAGLVRMVGI